MNYLPSINILGDVAGHLKEMLLLLNKMPKADLVLGVGDLVDRGPDGKGVIEWFMDDPFDREAIHGNHENMMLEALLSGVSETSDVWLYNGGYSTWDSYKGNVPQEHLRWLANRPLWYKQDGLFVSHAPVTSFEKIPAQYEDWRQFTITKHGENSFIWRRKPINAPMPGHFSVYGHNSRFVENKILDSDGNETHYSTCIDNSRNGKLMGLHWPSKQLYSVDYIK